MQNYMCTKNKMAISNIA